MPTTVRMYDCGFGDCFRLTYTKPKLPAQPKTEDMPSVKAAPDDDAFQRKAVRNPSHLYVDFGLHPHAHRLLQAQLHETVAQRYDRIIDDMPDDCDFLLTHYHWDHYSGVIHMIGNSTKRFHNVYIPDVWRIGSSVQVVHLLLLRGLLSRTVLNQGLSLIQFLISICHITGRVHFVSRGTPIQDPYVALWPSEELLAKQCDALTRILQRDWYGFPIMEETVAAELTIIATRLRNIVLQMAEGNPNADRERIITELERLEQDYLQLSGKVTVPNSIGYRLSEFTNTINIVFHNHEGQNVLFTGDAEKSAMTAICKNTDGRFPLHDTYDIIKIPHHGTAGHYFSFRDLSNEQTIYLIPNGHVHTPSWFIDSKYHDDIIAVGNQMICSGHGCCQKNLTGRPCICPLCQCISPNLYIDR